MNRMEKRQLKPHWLQRRRRIMGQDEEVGPLASVPGSDVIIVPGGGISSSNAQDAIMELDAEKVAKAGDTMTGDLLISRTWTQAGTLYGAFVVSVTNTASTLGSSMLEVKVGGQTCLSYNTNSSGRLTLRAMPPHSQTISLTPRHDSTGACTVTGASSYTFDGAVMIGTTGSVTSTVSLTNSTGVLAINARATVSADPTVPLGVATKQYVDAVSGGISQAAADARYVNIDGDAMTSSLSITGNLTASGNVTATNAVAGGSVFSGVATNVGTYYFGTSTSRYLAHDGTDFTLSNPLVLPASDPTNANHAARKAYVDTKVDTKVAKTGDYMTGDLYITKATARMTVDGFDNSGAFVSFRRGGVARWNILGAFGAETGSNAGSDLFIQSFNDAGGGGVNVVQITRQTGLMQVLGDPTAPLGVATKQYTDTKVVQYVDSRPVGICFPFSGKPAASASVFTPMTFAVAVPASLAGTVFICNTASTGSAVFTLNKLTPAGAVTTMGTITVTAGTKATITLSGTGGSLAIGDALVMNAPSTQDATLSDLGITIQVLRA